MIALMYLLALAAYLAIMFFAVRFAWRKGVARGSRKRAWIYSGIAFFVVYMSAFWDLIPTLAAHRYYCAKDGGLTVYKDPQEWLAEHEGELEILRVQSGGESVNQDLSNGWRRSHLINKSIAVDLNKNRFDLLGVIEIRRQAQRLVDLTLNETLVEQVSYGSGRSFNSGGVKFWLNRSGCGSSFSDFRTIHQLLYIHEEPQR